MFVKSLAALSLAGVTLAQNTPTLVQALNSSTELSQLSAVLQLNPGLVETLGGANNITILAPSNRAFARVPNATLAGLTSNPAALTALLQYHVLNGTVRAAQITNSSTFVPTLLTNPQFTNVTGGQRVEALLSNGNATFITGLLANSTVAQADVNFTGGVIHVIDNLLTIPENITETLTAGGLTSLRGALSSFNLTGPLSAAKDLTIFAPSNAALQSIGGGLAGLSPQDVTNILSYHVINGTVGYSSGLANGTVIRAANGANLTITINSGRVFVNNARVIATDILVANGVVHVIDAVLNPNNATIANPSATAGSPAFSGAASASEAPFTSGQPSATRTLAPDNTNPANAPGASGGMTSTGGAAPMQTGALGMGALLGAAAVYFL